MAKLNKSTSTSAKMKASGAKYSTTNSSGKQSFYSSSNEGSKAIGTSSRSSSSVIPMDAMQNTDVPKLPDYPVGKDVGNLAGANMAGIEAMFQGLDANAQAGSNEQLTAQSEKSKFDILKGYLGMQAEPPKQADLYTDTYGVSEKQIARDRRDALAERNNQQASLNSIIAKQQSDLLSVRGQGSTSGATEAVYGGQQATINREAAIAALPVQAALMAAQGNLDEATRHLDNLFKLKSEDATAKYNYESKMVDAVYNFATTSQQNILTAKLADKKAVNDQTQNNLTYLRQLSAEARANGNSGALAKLGNVDPADANFESVVAGIAQGIVKPVSPKAPDLHNFGTSDNPDWRQYNSETGTYDEVQGLDIGTGSNLSKAQKAKISDSIAANQELDKVLTEYKSLLDDVGFEGSTLGGANLGTYRALKAKMTTILKAAETLGTLDEGVRQLVNDIVGEIPEKGVAGQNVFGFQSRMISSQLATTQRLIQESIATKQERLGANGQMTFEALPEEDLAGIYDSFGVSRSTPSGAFNPDQWLNP